MTDYEVWSLVVGIYVIHYAHVEDIETAKAITRVLWDYYQSHKLSPDIAMRDISAGRMLISTHDDVIYVARAI